MAPDGLTHARPRIFAVIVLYRQLPRASTTVASLEQALLYQTLDRHESVDCAVLVYDNSPAGGEDQPVGGGAASALPDGFRYQAATANRGLFGAYDAALQAARAEGYDWLLTLDQDTSLPLDFFSAIQPGLAAASADPRIATIVPHLAEGNRRLSPAYVGVGRAKPLPASFAGVPVREVRAFNSAAVLRVSAIEAIGGFDPCFWLDHLDSWLHRELFRHGWRMYVLNSVHLEHHFSLLNYRERVSIEHFRNFLGAESAFFDLYGSMLEGMAYTAQLGGRMLNQARRREAPEIRQATWKALLRRLTRRKGERVGLWREAMDCTDRSPSKQSGPKGSEQQ